VKVALNWLYGTQIFQKTKSSISFLWFDEAARFSYSS
jgi:hypothetical protein